MLFRSSLNNLSDVQLYSPSSVTPAPLPTQDVVQPPQVTSPDFAKQVAQRPNDSDKPIIYNFNHYGDLDNEERANKVLKSIATKMGFENKRAGRTVNRPKATTS